MKESPHGRICQGGEDKGKNHGSKARPGSICSSVRGGKPSIMEGAYHPAAAGLPDREKTTGLAGGFLLRPANPGLCPEACREAPGLPGEAADEEFRAPVPRDPWKDVPGPLPGEAQLPATFIRLCRAAVRRSGGHDEDIRLRQGGSDVLLPGGGHRAEVYAHGGVRAAGPESGVPSAPRRAASRAMVWRLTAVGKGTVPSRAGPGLHGRAPFRKEG